MKYSGQELWKKQKKLRESRLCPRISHIIHVEHVRVSYFSTYGLEYNEKVGLKRYSLKNSRIHYDIQMECKMFDDSPKNFEA